MAEEESQLDRSSLDNFIASLWRAPGPQYSMELGSRFESAADDIASVVSEASDVSFGPTNPRSIALERWGLAGGAAIAPEDDEDASPSSMSAPFVAPHSASVVTGGWIADGSEVDLSAKANFSDAVQARTMVEVDRKEKFLKVAARATGRPFEMDTTPPHGKDFRWLSWIPMPRVAVSEMLRKLGEAPFAARAKADMAVVKPDLTFDLNDPMQQKLMFDRVAELLGKRWHAVATSKPRTAGGGNVTSQDVWPKRRGWNSTRNMELTGKGTFAWQAKLVRLANTRPLRDEDEDQDALMLTFAQLRRLRRGAMLLFDVLSRDATDATVSGPAPSAQIPASPFEATIEPNVAARVLAMEHDTGFITHMTQVMNTTWKLDARAVSADNNTLTYTFKRRGHGGVPPVPDLPLPPAGRGSDGRPSGRSSPSGRGSGSGRGGRQTSIWGFAHGRTGSNRRGGDRTGGGRTGGGRHSDSKQSPTEQDSKQSPIEQDSKQDGQQVVLHTNGDLPAPVPTAIETQLAAILGQRAGNGRVVPAIAGIQGGNLLQVVEDQCQADDRTDRFRNAFCGGPSCPTETLRDLRGGIRWSVGADGMVNDSQRRTDAQVNNTLWTGLYAFHRGIEVLKALEPAFKEADAIDYRTDLWTAAHKGIHKGNVLQEACLGMAAIVGSVVMTLDPWLRVALKYNHDDLQEIITTQRVSVAKKKVATFWTEVFQSLEGSESLSAFDEDGIKRATELTMAIGAQVKWEDDGKRGTKPRISELATAFGNSVFVQVEVREEGAVGDLIAWLHMQDVDTMGDGSKVLPRTFDMPSLWSDAQWNHKLDGARGGGRASAAVKAHYQNGAFAMDPSTFGLPDTTLKVFKDGALTRPRGPCDLLEGPSAHLVYLGAAPKKLTNVVKVTSLPTKYLVTLASKGRDSMAAVVPDIGDRLGAHNNSSLLFTFMGAKLQDTDTAMMSTLASDGFGAGVALTSYYHYTFKFQRSFAIHKLNDTNYEGWEALPDVSPPDGPYVRNKKDLATQWKVFPEPGTAEGDTPAMVPSLAQTVVPAKRVDTCGCVRVVAQSGAAKARAERKWGTLNDLIRMTGCIEEPYRDNNYNRTTERENYDAYEEERKERIKAGKATMKDNAELFRVHGLGGALRDRGKLMRQMMMYRPFPNALAVAEFLDTWAMKVLESRRGVAALAAWRG